ncbi:ABC transporter permease [Microbacterium mitrae]
MIRMTTPRSAITAGALRVLVMALFGVLIIWAAATLAFVITNVLPGDPVEVMLGPQAQISDEVKDALREELGLTQPLWNQYVAYISGLAHGDLGESLQLRMPVVDVIGRQFGSTLQLTALALLFALVIAAAVTLLARGPRSRRVAATAELIVLSAPVFWIGLLLLTVFAFGLGWFPVSGSRGAASLVLPALTLALPCAALIGQLVRDGVEEAEQQPFAFTVRARGASDLRLLTHHTLRHGSIGAVTMAGYLIGSLLGGAVLVETVFARQGVGRVALTAIINRDLPVIAGVIVLSALIFTVIAIVSDVVMTILDPRLRGGGRRS